MWNIENYKFLARQIIGQTISDIKKIKPQKIKHREIERIRNREDAEMFFYSEWFKELCEFSQRDNVKILRKYQKYIDFDDVDIKEVLCGQEK